MSWVIRENHGIPHRLSERRRKGAAASVNESTADFLRCGEHIRFGLLAVKGLGQGLIQKMTEQRQKAGKFTGLADFCRRMLPLGLNKQALDSLIRCGALDSLGLNRRQMLEYQEQVLMDCREERSSIVTGQMNLFGGESEAVRETPIPSLPELERSALLQLEHESLGLYLSGHPLEQSQWLRQLAVPRRRLHCRNSRTAGKYC